MAKNQNNNVAPATQKTEPGAKKDALATALAQIEKQFGKGAIMKLGDNTAMQVDAISTGSLGLDLALGVGGVPRGRIIEVFGPESSGKTTLALHILAEAQKKGGEVAFIDVEHALDPAYASALGVNIDELLVSQPKTPNSIRKLAIPQRAVELLVEEHAKHPHSPHLFVSPKTGTMFDPDSFRHTHEKILKAIGAEHIRFHDLRHPYVKHTTKIFILRLMNFQAQAYPDAR